MDSEVGFRKHMISSRSAQRCKTGKRTLILWAIAAVLTVMPTIAKSPTVEFGKNTVKVEVASTPDQIQRGLMYRTSMPEDHGMVFLFRPPHGVRFWMAHCFISLDMVMIRAGKVVHIFENVPPCKASNENECPTYPAMDQPEVEVDEVVEVNAGYAKRHGIKVGDSVTFKLGAAVPAKVTEPAKAPAKPEGDAKPGAETNDQTKPADEAKPEAGK